MNDEKFINEFKTFRTTFESRIKKNKITYYDNDCYLIDKKWYNVLENNIDNYEINNNEIKKGINSNINIIKRLLPQQSPVFINDMNKVIEHLKYNNNLQIINTKIMEKIIKQKILKNIEVFKYFPGYNNLILIFFGNEYKDGLFIFNPLERNDKNNILFSFKTKNNNKDNDIQIYSELLQMGENLNKEFLDRLKKLNMITDYKIIKYYEEISYTYTEYIKNNNSKENLLTILISIFYYEKGLELNIKDTFSKSCSKKFNLISHSWFNNLKKNYNYGELYDLLSDYDMKKGVELIILI